MTFEIVFVFFSEKNENSPIHRQPNCVLFIFEFKMPVRNNIAAKSESKTNMKLYLIIGAYFYCCSNRFPQNHFVWAYDTLTQLIKYTIHRSFSTTIEHRMKWFALHQFFNQLVFRNFTKSTGWRASKWYLVSANNFRSNSCCFFLYPLTSV